RADLVELRTPLRDIARASFDRLGCSHPLCRSSCGCLCRGVCDGELRLRRVCIAMAKKTSVTTDRTRVTRCIRADTFFCTSACANTSQTNATYAEFTITNTAA